MFTFDQPTAQALRNLCQKFAVKSLKLFGSAVGETFDPARSDLDFLVEFDVPPTGMRLNEQYFAFLDELQALFARPVDLLEEHAIENSRLRRNALAEAVTLYAA